MKKLLLSLIAFSFLSFGVMSCGSKSNPKDVAQNFLSSLTKMDYEGAKKYGTPDTGKMLDMLASFSSMMEDSIKNKAKDVKVAIKDVKEEGDKATVTYTNTDKEGDQTLNLVKQDGKWLVNMSKEDSMNGAADNSIPADVPAEEGAAADSMKVDVKK